MEHTVTLDSEKLFIKRHFDRFGEKPSHVWGQDTSTQLAMPKAPEGSTDAKDHSTKRSCPKSYTGEDGRRVGSHTKQRYPSQTPSLLIAHRMALRQKSQRWSTNRTHYKNQSRPNLTLSDPIKGSESRNLKREYQN